MHQKISIPLVVTHPESGERTKVGQAVLTYICPEYVDITAKITDPHLVEEIMNNNPATIVLGDLAVSDTPKTPHPISEHDHNPVQHRDGKPPWCKDCGLTADHLIPLSRIPSRAPSKDDFL